MVRKLDENDIQYRGILIFEGLREWALLRVDESPAESDGPSRASAVEWRDDRC